MSGLAKINLNFSIAEIEILKEEREKKKVLKLQGGDLINGDMCVY